MSKIEEIIYAEPSRLSQYNEILYNLNFIEDILEVKPENVMLSDDSLMWHFGCDEDELKHKLFYKFGYVLEDSDEKLIDVLHQVKENISLLQPLDLHAFWAVPARLCLSHSHPALARQPC